MSRSCPLILVLAAIAAPLSAQPEPTQSEGHVHTSRKGARLLPLPRSDEVWHFVVFGDRTGGPASGVKVLKQAVTDTNLLDPDLVMTVGDLVQGYNLTPRWLKQMREFRRIMDRLRRPWYPVAGNHDVYWDRGLKAPPGEHDKDYEKHFGPLWYWFRHKNAAFIVLYSDEGDPKDGSKGYKQERHTQFSAVQIAWLGKTLQECSGARHVFVFLHHPRWYRLKYPARNNWPDVHTMLVKAGNVRAVFAGHIHRMHYAGRKDGIHYLALATTGGALPRTPFARAGHLHHFNVVTVRKAGISQATIPVGAVMDPREMTSELHAELDLLLAMQSPRAVAHLGFRQDGSASGPYVIEIANPTSRPVVFNLSFEGDRAMLRAVPNHRHEKIGPGASKRVRFDLDRPAIPLDHTFQAPRLLVQMDYLGKTTRIALPEREWLLDARLKGKPAERTAASPNQVLDLDGRSGCLRVRSADLKVPRGAFTVEGWLKARTLKGRRPFLAKSENSEFYLFVSDGKPSFGVHLGKRYCVASSNDATLLVNRWHHVAGVFDGNEVRVYLDGRIAARRVASGERTRNHVPLYVGADPDRKGRPTDFLSGLVDEVRVSSGARYLGDSFAPVTRHTPDGDTLLLLHCDRPAGPFALNAAAAWHPDRLGTARLLLETLPTSGQ